MNGSDQAYKRTLVIGAGIIGASIAYHLAKRGVAVTIVDRTGIAAGATGKSFAWINAHHFRREGYHRLRYQSLNEYHLLDRELGGALGLDWCGALSFDAAGDAFDARISGFQKLGYPIEVLSHNQFRECEPGYHHPPDRALYLPLEAAVDPVRACRALIDGAIKFGARTCFGCEVEGLHRDDDRIEGIETPHGAIEADQIVLSAGVGAESLLAAIDVDLPMANRFGVMLKSRPIERVLNHIIWGDRIHMKQQADGRLVIGEVFSEDWTERNPAAIAVQMLEDARRHLPEVTIEIEHETIGVRPIPKDGMPVVGAVDGVQGLYAAVMHSGMTLAPIIGRMTTGEILDGVCYESLEPYRLRRFQESGTKAAS